MTTNIETLEAKHRALGEQLKAARRAEAKRQREREVAAEQSLGRWMLREWLTVEAADGADIDARVAALREALANEKVREFVAEKVRRQLAPTAGHEAAQPDEPVTAEGGAYHGQ